MVSGANDKLIKLWDIRTHDIISTLKGHICPINCIQILNDKVITVFSIFINIIIDCEWF